MLRRVLMLAVLAAIGFLVFRIRKKYLAEAAPEVPNAWDGLAQREPRFLEVLELRRRLIKLVQRHQTGDERRRMMDDVHGCAGALAELAERRLDLGTYLRELGQQAPAPLHERAERLDTEIDASVDGLRQVYSDMLAALEMGPGDLTAAKKTHDLLEGLQRRAQAEREIATALRDDS